MLGWRTIQRQTRVFEWAKRHLAQKNTLIFSPDVSAPIEPQDSQQVTAFPNQPCRRHVNTGSRKRAFPRVALGLLVDATAAVAVVSNWARPLIWLHQWPAQHCRAVLASGTRGRLYARGHEASHSLVSRQPLHPEGARTETDEEPPTPPRDKVACLPHSVHRSEVTINNIFVLLPFQVVMDLTWKTAEWDWDDNKEKKVPLFRYHRDRSACVVQLSRPKGGDTPLFNENTHACFVKTEKDWHDWLDEVRARLTKG